MIISSRGTLTCPCHVPPTFQLYVYMSISILSSKIIICHAVAIMPCSLLLYLPISTCGSTSMKIYNQQQTGRMYWRLYVAPTPSTASGRHPTYSTTRYYYYYYYYTNIPAPAPAKMLTTDRSVSEEGCNISTTTTVSCLYAHVPPACLICLPSFNRLAR